MFPAKACELGVRMDEKRSTYLAYLLRVWLAEGEDVWRAALEAPDGAERHGFATLDGLYAFLDAQTREMAAAQAAQTRAAKTQAAQTRAEKKTRAPQ